MAPPVLYAKSGDVHVAYTVRGSGPDLVWCPGSLSHQELWPQIPEFARILDGPARFARVIFFDKRGTGMSDRPAGIPTLEERIDDIRAVRDAAQSERAHIFGVSEGGSMACLFAATYPQRTRSLLLYGTRPRWTRAPDRLPVGTDRRGGRGKSPEVDRGWVQARLHVRIHAEVAGTRAPRRSGVPRGLRTHAADVGDPGGADRARADESAHRRPRDPAEHPGPDAHDR